MNSKFKFLMVLILFSLFVGAVSGASIIDDDFKIHDGFTMEDVGDWYKNNDNIELGIIKYHSVKFNNTLNSHDSYQVTDLGNNTYTSTSDDMAYAFELIEVNNNKYQVTAQSKDKTKINDCYDVLMEFNKLNNLEPITPPE